MPSLWLASATEHVFVICKTQKKNALAQTACFICLFLTVHLSSLSCFSINSACFSAFCFDCLPPSRPLLIQSFMTTETEIFLGSRVTLQEQQHSTCRACSSLFWAEVSLLFLKKERKRILRAANCVMLLPHVNWFK